MDKSIYDSYSSNPACLAILETVNGLSPEIIFTVTPSPLKNPSISFAFFLNGSDNSIAAIIFISGNLSSTTSLENPTRRTLFPCFCASIMFSFISKALFAINLSGAPTIIEPIPLNEIELHFLSDEN